jgi:hypothetical protein
MPENLASNKCVRRAHRGVVTKKLAEVETVLADAGDNPNLIKAGQLHLSLKEKLEMLKRLDERIFEATSDETALEADLASTDDVNSTIYEALIKLERLLSPPMTNHADNIVNTSL